MRWTHLPSISFVSARVFPKPIRYGMADKCLDFLGTNLEASMRTDSRIPPAIIAWKLLTQHLSTAISSSDLTEYVLGSKLQLTAWYSYTALIWSLKGTMLCFLSRLTIGTWHNRVVKLVSLACVLSYIAVFLTVRREETTVVAL